MENRLIAFGCSHTYGGALSANQDSPSPLAWPNLLANLSNRKCVNVSRRGSSNKRIWNDVVNFEFQKNDVVFIMWTDVSRTCIIKENEIEDIGVWNINDNDASLKYYQSLFDLFDSVKDLNIRSSHCDLYLNSLGVKNYHLVYSEILIDHKVNAVAKKLKTLDRKSYRKEAFNKANLLRLDFSEISKSYDKALDGRHPGELAHKELANKIFSEVQNEIKI